MADQLRRAGARLIVYDVQFTEPSPDPQADMALFEAFGRAGGALLATAESRDDGSTNVLGGDARLAEIGARAGASNLPDDGGVIRRYRRRVGRLPTLATLTAERLGRPLAARAFGSTGAWIDFRGGPGTFRMLSFSDVHDGRVGAGALRGKVVVVGAAAASLQALHRTPTSGRRTMSGPEVQANALWTALHGTPCGRRPPGRPGSCRWCPRSRSSSSRWCSGPWRCSRRCRHWEPSTWPARSSPSIAA